MKNVLVTGGAGFIGCNFIRHLLEARQDVRVINLDALTYAGSPANLEDLPAPDRHIFIHGDIRDEELVDHVIMEHRIDTIIHFAAETHVDRSIAGPAPFITTNIFGTYNLLEAARKRWLGNPGMQAVKTRFHHVSTDEVYGSLAPDAPAFTESHPYAPNSPYAASKASSDFLVRAYARTYGLSITITNCSNNYGPYQFPEKLIPLALLNALRGEPIPIYGDGGQIRDWLYVRDHCAAILAVLERGEPGETYNVGGNNQPTNLQLVRKLCRILDDRLPNSPNVPHENLITFVVDRPGHDRRYAMDIRRIREQIGWEPQETLDSGLAKTVDWYLAHQDWIATILERPSYQEWLERNYRERGGS